MLTAQERRERRQANQQARRRANLQRMGENLQNRLSTFYMDVIRTIPVPIGPTLIYSNIKVNVGFSSADNPDPQTAPTSPVLESVRVNLPHKIEVRNDDSIILKVLGANGKWKGAFRGVAGNPYEVNSRKRFHMNVSALGAGDDSEGLIPPPVEELPPPDPNEISIITISFKDTNDDKIMPAVIYEKERGEMVDIPSLDIHGYNFLHTIVDGVIYNFPSVAFIATNPTYEITFVYSAETSLIYLRPFVLSGNFKDSNGVSKNGAHWYRRLDFTVVVDDPLTVHITSPPLGTTDPRITHSESRGIIRLVTGARVLVEPDNAVMEVVTSTRQGNGWDLTLEPTTWIDAEITRWYD